jgi:hypothetical protein
VPDVLRRPKDFGAGDESGYFRRNVLCHLRSTFRLSIRFSFENERDTESINLLLRC